MINEKQTQAKILEEGQSQGSIGMSLDLDSAQVLMQMLSKNLYSDPIGSTVRECASNALDSHRRAKVTEAIVVSLKVNTENNYEFTVEDFGTGLDNKDVEDIISKYGKSTKRDSNEELGMMGLGFKSPLAYSSSFYFVCRKDGVERKYMMYEGEDVNTIDLLFEKPTTERNGVKVIVPVKYNDRNMFFEKIKNQLAYFESVYFDVNVGNNVITNEFHIHRAKDFQLSEMNTDQFLHICLDNVYYPLDFAKLGIPQTQLPIGLRFALGDGLFPTPNREQIIYSSQAKATILAKIQTVATQLVEKYNEHSVECSDIHEIFAYYCGAQRFVKIGETPIDVNKIIHHSTVNFKPPQYSSYKYTDFALLARVKDQILSEYRVNILYTRDQFRVNNGYYNTTLMYSHTTEKFPVYLYKEIFTGNKKSYIKSTLPRNTYDQIRFVKKERRFTLRKKHSGHFDNYYDMLGLRRYPREEWRERIIEFQNVQAELVKDFIDVDATVIPQDWLDARKRIAVSTSGTGTRRVKLQGEVNCRIAEELQRFVSGKSSKLVPKVLKVEDIESSPFLLVYGRQKDEDVIDGLFAITGKQKIKYIVLSEREHKVVETLDIHNLMSIEKFMKGENKPFKRLVTGYLIHNLIKQYADTFGKVKLLVTISKTLHDNLITLSDYSSENYVSYCDEKVYDAMLKISEEFNLYDETIYTEYKQIKELLDNFPFIETTLEVLPTYATNPGNEHYLTVLADLFKYHKIRIDYTNYHLVLNEEVSIEEPMTDDEIKELEENV